VSAVKKANNLRMDFIRKAFSELGFAGDDLEMRTMLFACYHTWEASMFPGVSRKRRKELIGKRVDLLTAKIPSWTGAAVGPLQRYQLIQPRNRSRFFSFCSSLLRNRISTAPVPPWRTGAL